MCLGVFCLGFILSGTLWVSWTWVIISLPILGKFSTIISSSIFFLVFLFVFFFWDSYNLNVGAFHIVLEVSRLFSFLLICFSFFLSDSFISTILSSTSLILSSACYSTIRCLQSVFDFIYCIIHYILTLFYSF